MWKFIFLALALYVLYKLFANDFLKKRKVDAKEEQEEIKRRVDCGEMVKDPECGTYVSVDDSISVKDGNQVYYFCGYECRDKFLKKLENGSRNISEGDRKDS